MDGIHPHSVWKVLAISIETLSHIKSNTTVNVMPQGKEDGQTLRILTQNKTCVRIPIMGYGWTSGFIPILLLHLMSEF